MKRLQQYKCNRPSSQSFQKTNWIDSKDINKVTVLKKKNPSIEQLFGIFLENRN